MRESSTERVPLVLLPGLDGTDVFLRPLRAALPAALPVRVIEYPAELGGDYPTLLAHLRSALAGLPRMHLLGLSYGGPLALLFAQAEPSRVLSVCLVASFVASPFRGWRCVCSTAVTSPSTTIPSRLLLCC